MMRIGLAAFTILFLTAGVLAHPVSMSDVARTVQIGNMDDAAELPAPGSPTGPCTLSHRLNFTVSAIDEHSFRHLFAPNTDARSVIITWYSNTNDDTRFPDDTYRSLKSALFDLYQEITLPAYDNLTFGKMVDYRLRGTFPKSMANLDLKLDALVAAEFDFPLFQRIENEDVERRLELLLRFVKIRTGPACGGMGNLSFHALFYTPAFPYKKIKKTGFSVVRVRKLIRDMQGYILPKPSLICDGIFIMSGQDHCCCNNATHDTCFRTCTAESGGYCLDLGGNFCSVASSTPCGGHSHPNPCD